MTKPSTIQLISLDLRTITPWGERAKLDAFYNDISPLIPATIIAAHRDADPVTSLDRLLVRLRLLREHPGVTVVDSFDLAGLDAWALLTFLWAAGLPVAALSVKFWPRTLEQKVVGVRVTRTKPVGSEDLGRLHGVPVREDHPLLFVVSGSYREIKDRSLASWHELMP